MDFEGTICAAGAKAIDPDAVIREGGLLHLYFPYSGCPTAGTGGGLYRATAFSASTGRVYGRDFYLDQSTDMLARGGSEGEYLNPTVIRMPDGSWRVYAGGGEAYPASGLSSDLTTMNVFVVDASDGG